MKFLTVTVSNFMALDHAYVELADRGLVLVQGINEDDASADSNGAGKSSIVDAISWCLYGKTARGEDGDNVVNRFGSGGAEVNVTLESEELVWTITRFRKHKTHGNALNVVSHDGVSSTTHTKGTTKLTQDLIDKLLGCTYEVFAGAIYAGQNSFPDLPGMTDKNLKLLVEEAAGTNVLSAAYDLAKWELVKREAASQSSQKNLEKTSIALETATEALDAAKNGWNDYESERNIKVDLAKARHAMCRADLANSLHKHSELELPRVTLKIDAIDMALASVTLEQAEERSLAEAFGKKEHKAAIAKAAVEEFRRQHTREAAAFKAMDTQIGEPCPECARPITADEIAPAKAKIKERANKIRKQFDDAKTALEQCVSELGSAADALGAHRAAMTDVTETMAQRVTLAAIIEQGVVLSGQIAALKNDDKRLSKEIDEIFLCDNPFSKLKTEAEAKIATLEVSKTTLAEEAAEAIMAEKVAKAAVKIYAPAGVRAHILDQVTPYLNDQTAKYLGTLSDGNLRATWSTLIKSAKGELRECFSIEVENELGAASFQGISGGEQRKVRVATALALQDLIATRAVKPIELFIADEVDAALDAAGQERLMLIFEEKAKTCKSLFIISHNDLKNWCPNVMTVTKKGKVSTIEETV